MKVILRKFYVLLDSRGLIFNKSKIKHTLHKLNPTAKGEILCQEYYVEKLKILAIVLGIGVILGTSFFIKERMVNNAEPPGTVIRKEYYEETRKRNLICRVENMKLSFEIEAPTRVLAKDEAEVLCNEFISFLETTVLGNNESLSAVSSDLVFLNQYEPYPFYVTWKTEDDQLISNTGKIQDVESDEEVEVTAIIEYSDYSWTKRWKLTVVPPDYGDPENLRNRIGKLIDLNLHEGSEKEIKLPESVENIKIEWQQRKEKTSYWIFAVTAILILVLFFAKDIDLEKELEHKKKTMILEYPELVQKLSMYLGAGMSTRNVFYKLARDYEKQRNQGGEKSPIYEEILYLCREMDLGLSEGRAYEEMGKRVGIREYVGLGNILSQNLKRGSIILATRLEQEVNSAFVEKIQRCRKLGEEASSKLLVPMTMLLAIIMVMIMIPAFGGMNI